MANLGDLKTRIISETVRDDLADDLKAQFDVMIRGAIEEWADQHFWFNEGRVVQAMVPLAEFQTIPTTIRLIDSFWLTVGGNRYEMLKRSMEEMEDLSIITNTGQPTDWCEFAGDIRVLPRPNLPYPMVIICVQDVSPPLDFTQDTSENAWTNVAQDLIVATTKKRLYRDYLSAVATDPRLSLAMTQEAAALSQLSANSNRRIATGRVRAGW